MPAIRNTVASVSQVSKVQILSLKNSGRPAQTTPTAEADSDASSLKAIDYPARDSLARATFIGENGKVSLFQKPLAFELSIATLPSLYHRITGRFMTSLSQYHQGRS
ncbi:hypothetical protein FRB95_008227 [Tulasnella sp. JGI-2019a]|nr:hypothetical protein FRB95_008227 [Tulasnella sp. JGI-2019a]